MYLQNVRNETVYFSFSNTNNIHLRLLIFVPRLKDLKFIWKEKKIVPSDGDDICRFQLKSFNLIKVLSKRDSCKEIHNKFKLGGAEKKKKIITWKFDQLLRSIYTENSHPCKRVEIIFFLIICIRKKMPVVNRKHRIFELLFFLVWQRWDKVQIFQHF